MAKVTKTYNGWKNYNTWNVALFFSNDEVIQGAKDFFADQLSNSGTKAVKSGFKHFLIENYLGGKTSDGVAVRMCHINAYMTHIA